LHEYEKVKQKAKILVEGKFSFKDIYCFYYRTKLQFNNKEKECIENEWKKAIKHKPFLFAGPLFHLQNYKNDDSKITLEMFKSTFKEYVGTHNNVFQRMFGQSKIVKPLSVGTMIITSDSKWITGKRSNTYSYQGFYTLIAGYIDPHKDIINSRPDPFSAIKREIIEETGIHNDHIDDIVCLGLVDGRDPYLAFVCTLNISSEDLSHVVPKEEEFVKLEQIELEEQVVKRFLLSNYNNTTPHAFANILMYCRSGLFHK
jgi:8-oxo-dGTP pyrophosphatase MutT (NUDIX family)